MLAVGKLPDSLSVLVAAQPDRSLVIQNIRLVNTSTTATCYVNLCVRSASGQIVPLFTEALPLKPKYTGIEDSLVYLEPECALLGSGSPSGMVTYTIVAEAAK